MNQVAYAEALVGGRLRGKRTFVTAAAQGIGRATALRFAAEGAGVVAVDINADKLRELEREGLETLTLDATDRDAVARAIDRQPRLDVLVNCVGRVHQGTILECDPEEWQLSFRVNVDTVYNATRAALPKMIAQHAGSIINIASIASSVKAVPSRAVYSATKAAVIGLTKSVAVDYVGQGIRCNAVCPGTIESPSLEERIASFADPVAARAAFIARQPMGRLGAPDEIAALCAYLAADESAFMTGAVLVIDGGMAA